MKVGFSAIATGKSISTLSIQHCGNAGKACLLSERVQLHAKCILEHFCDECNELFFLLIWAVVFFLFPSVRKDLWYSSHILAVLPLLFLFTCFERGRAAPCASFCALGQFCCVVLWPWTSSCLSTQRSPLACETNEKSEMTASERKWFVLWRETWKDVHQEH